MRTIRRVILLALALTLMLPTTAFAGSPGTWTRATGEDAWFELNLQRYGGKLHVSVREDQTASTYRLLHRAISSAGKVGAPHTIASDFEYLGSYPGIVPIGVAGEGGLRILFGSKATGDGFPNKTMRYVDSTDGGETWGTPVQTSVTDGPAQDPSEMDATIGPSGISYQVWEGTLCICVQRGLGPQSSHTNFNDVGGTNLNPSIAYDRETNKVWVSWLVFGNNADGIYVREVNLATGEPTGSSMLVPGSFDTYNGDRLINFQNGRVPMVQRRTHSGGDSGVYVAYRKGYPSASVVRVWRVGTPGAGTIARTAKGVGEVALAADHQGRIWVLWVSDGKIFAKRSNKNGGLWGKTVSVKIPADSVGTTTLQADAQNKKVDVLAYASKVNGSGFFHTQLLPGITFKASPSKFRGKATVAFTTRDAGVPLPKSKVTVGGKSCTTNKDGRCSITLGPYSSSKRLKAKATHTGYVPASLTVRAMR